MPPVATDEHFKFLIGLGAFALRPDAVVAASITDPLPGPFPIFEEEEFDSKYCRNVVERDGGSLRFFDIFIANSVQAQDVR